MMVTLNEVAIARLLESETGPVGRDLQRRAENVTRHAEDNASGAILGIDTSDLHSGVRYTIGHDGQGLFATVGTDAQHRGFFYPAWWDQNGRPWLTFALIDGYDE